MRTALLLASLAVAGCQHERASSDVKVTNGSPVQDGVWPEVVRIKTAIGAGATSYCSATFVSKTTLITAAHCVDGVVTYDGVEAKEVVSHPFDDLFLPNGAFATSLDLAVVVFGSDVFPGGSAIKVNRIAPVQDAPVTIVGFGKTDVDQPDSVVTAGKKHEGLNQILKVAQGEIIVVGTPGPSADLAQGEFSNSAPGDSGGPLLFESSKAIVGVVSNGKVVTNQSGMKFKASYYADLTSEKSRALLCKALGKGAVMNGFTASEC